MWSFEKEQLANGFSLIAGVDEVGRGPLAGPVVSAAVILPEDFHVPGVTDSKKISSKKRDLLYEEIYLNATSIGIGIVDPVEIDRINILRASLLSMSIAVSNLYPEPDFLLVDGKFPVDISIRQSSIIKGDSLSVSIAAASIIAKVTRDSIMKAYDFEYPLYGFSKNKGYPTKAHREALARHGCCPIHRRSFNGVIS